MADIEEEVLDDEVDRDLDLDEGQRSLRRKRRRAKREESSVSEAISSNITRILEGLLKDYDKTERPGFKTGKLIGRGILIGSDSNPIEIPGIPKSENPFIN